MRHAPAPPRVLWTREEERPCALKQTWRKYMHNYPFFDFFSLIPQNLSILMWKSLPVAVFRRQQEVEQHDRHMKGGHLSEKKRPSEHRTPTGVKENDGM